MYVILSWSNHVPHQQDMLICWSQVSCDCNYVIYCVIRESSYSEKPTDPTHNDKSVSKMKNIFHNIIKKLCRNRNTSVKKLENSSSSLFFDWPARLLRLHPRSLYLSIVYHLAALGEDWPLHHFLLLNSSVLE